MQTVTGSRKVDRVICVVIALAMVLLLHRLAVYYSATVIVVTVERIDADGRSTALPTPAAFERIEGGSLPIDAVEPRVRRRIEDDMAKSPWADTAPPGATFVWTVRYSRNHARLDRKLSIAWEVDDGH